MLSSALYLVMAFLQLIEVCLTMILCASIFALRPIFAISSIQCVCSEGFVGSGGTFRLLSSSRDFMSGWFWRWVCECWHAARMALRVPWYILR